VVFGKIGLAGKLASLGVGKLLLEIILRFVLQPRLLFFSPLATASISTVHLFLN